MKKIFFVLIAVVLLIVGYFFTEPYFSSRTNDFGITLPELKKHSELPYNLSLDISEISAGKTSKIIGGGKLRLPLDFQSSENPQIMIVHGTNLREINDFIKSSTFHDINNSDRLVVISALALKRCFMDEEKNIFHDYLENFKKTGDIFNSNGKVFYYIDKLKFNVQNDLSGIVFSLPGGSYFSNVKNYGLAHLIQNDFSQEGLHHPVNFLEYIKLPKPDGFDGTFKDLIVNAKTEFHTKCFDDVILMDTKQEMTVKNKILPFIELKKPSKILPLIGSVKFSKNGFFRAKSAPLKTALWLNHM